MKTVTFAVFWIGTIGLIVGTSSLFQSCTNEQYYQGAHENLYEHPAQILVLVETWMGCSGEFIHKYAEAIIAAFTVLLGIATWLLWRAAKALVVGAEDTAQRQLRAYIYLKGVNVVLSNNKLFGISDLKNTGQTPAYQVTTISRLETTEKGKPFVPLAFEETAAKDTGIIGPEGQFSARCALEIPPGNVIAIPAFKRGDGIIYLTGRVRYKDAFGRKWRFDFRFRSHLFDESRNSWIMAPTDEGNEESVER